MPVEMEKMEKIAYLKLVHRHTNGLDLDFLLEIQDTLTTVEEMPEVAIVIVTSGLPFGFSSGLDLKRFYARNDPVRTGDNVLQAVSQVYKIVNSILESDKIYIAAVHGPVIGSAVSIVLSCDIAVAAKTSWFWLPDPQFGGLMADGGLDLLLRLIGTSRTRMAALTNSRINADKAYQWGLLYDLVDGDQLDSKCLQLATNMSRFSIDTLVSTKRLIVANEPLEFQYDELRRIVNSEDMYVRLKSYLD